LDKGGLVGIILESNWFGIAAMDFAFVIPWSNHGCLYHQFIVAIASGLYPAIKAAVLDPIEALRYEIV
jgi:putative ABC transport system permease protein